MRTHNTCVPWWCDARQRAHLRDLQHAVLLLAERATGKYDVRMDEVRRLVAREVGVPHEAAQKKWVPRIG